MRRFRRRLRGRISFRRRIKIRSREGGSEALQRAGRVHGRAPLGEHVQPVRERIPRDDAGELSERGEQTRQLLGGGGETGEGRERVGAGAGAGAGGGGADGAFEQPRRVEEHRRERVR